MTLPVHEANSDHEFELIEFCGLAPYVRPTGVVIFADRLAIGLDRGLLRSIALAAICACSMIPSHAEARPCTPAPVVAPAVMHQIVSAINAQGINAFRTSSMPDNPLSALAISPITTWFSQSIVANAPSPAADSLVPLRERVKGIKAATIASGHAALLTSLYAGGIPENSGAIFKGEYDSSDRTLNSRVWVRFSDQFGADDARRFASNSCIETTEISGSYQADHMRDSMKAWGERELGGIVFADNPFLAPENWSQKGDDYAFAVARLSSHFDVAMTSASSLGHMSTAAPTDSDSNPQMVGQGSSFLPAILLT